MYKYIELVSFSLSGLMKLSKDANAERMGACYCENKVWHMLIRVKS